MPDEAELIAQIERMASELDRRTSCASRLDAYYDGKHPAPEAITASKAQKAYQRLLDLADTNWPQLIVDSVEERLEVQAIKLGADALDKRAWEIWQANGLDAESSLIHQSSLTAARSFVIVWPAEKDRDLPSVTPEHASTCIVEYATGSRRNRVAGLRRWCEGDDWYATLYRAEGTYKFKGATDETGGRTFNVKGWEKLEVTGEKWPLDNHFGGRIPMVEFAVNRRLRPNPFGVAYGEFETNCGHIDRINYAMFSQIVAMTWSGFPLRYKIGDPVLRDDDDQPIKPFDVQADSVVLIENPQGKLGQLPEASLENYGTTIDRYVEQLAALTKTPAHYLLGKLVNVSADAIRAAEAGLVSKVRRHHRSLGEAWEDVARLMLIADGADLSGTPAASAEVVWKDPESRSMAERADAASKLKDVLPWPALAAKILQATPQEISDWQTMIASDGLASLLAQPAPTAPPALAPVAP